MEGITGRIAVSDLTTAPPGTLLFRGAAGSSLVSGQVVAPAGDLDGDGRAELFLGYYLYRAGEGERREGRAFLVWGQAGLEGEQAVEKIGGEIPGVVFLSTDPSHLGVGSAAATLGDVNGDGEVDLAVGAATSNPQGRDRAGVVFLIFGWRQLEGTIDLAQVGKSIAGGVIHGVVEQIPGLLKYAALGVTIHPIGDFNGDGYDHVLLPAPELSPRKTYLVRGSSEMPTLVDLAQADTLDFVSVLTSRPLFAGPQQAASVGDLDGDGHADLLVGVSREEFGNFVYYLRGRPDFPKTVDFANLPPGLAVAFHPVTEPGEHFTDYFGRTLAPAGDLNRDGVADFLFGASHAIVRGEDLAGEVYAVFGSRSIEDNVFLADGFQGIRILGEGQGELFGSLIGNGGDFNSDGALDILVGAPQTVSRDNPRAEKVYILYGTGGRSRPLALNEIEPAFGSLLGGTSVVFRGSGFEPGARVFFGSSSAARLTFASTSELRVVAPPAIAPGFVDVSVEVGGVTRRLAGAYEYTPPFPEVVVGNLGEGGLVLPGAAGADVTFGLDFGDVTGDGIDDLLISTAVSDRPERVASVVHGARGRSGTLSPLEPGPEVSVIESPLVHVVGPGIAALGDLNGDGVEDLGLTVDGAAAFIIFGRRSFPETLSIPEELDAGTAASLTRGTARGSSRSRRSAT